MSQGPKAPPADAGAEATLERRGHPRRRRPLPGGGRPHDLPLPGLRGRLKQGPQKEQNVVVVGDRVLIQPLPPESRCGRARRRRRDGAAAPQPGLAAGGPPHRRAHRAGPDGEPRPGRRRAVGGRARRRRAAWSTACWWRPPATRCPSVLCLNKIDLDPAVAADARWDYYASLGVEVVRTSTVTGAGLEDAARTPAGPHLDPAGSLGRGQEQPAERDRAGAAVCAPARSPARPASAATRPATPSSSRWPAWRLHRRLARAAGVRSLGPRPGRPAGHWPDLLALGADCRFRTCLHRDEPDCAVKRAVARGRLPAWRHQAYLDILRDLEDRQRESQPY
jgi:hypothetical protein